MKITLTGSSGFIGRKLVDSSLLSSGGFELSTLKFQQNATIPYEPTPHQLKETKILLHCGASTPKNSFEANDLSEATSNVWSTSGLLQLDWQNLEKIVYLSTLDVYSHGSVISEETPPLPRTNYGWSKYISEAFVESFCRSKGITYSILRLGNLYGPGEEAYEKVIPSFIRKALMGNNLEISTNGNESRSFLYIDDAIEMIAQIVCGDLGNGIVNLVGEYPCTISELSELIISLSNTDVQIFKNEQQPTATSHQFDISKMKKLFPSPQVPLKIGLANEIQQFKL